MSITSQEYTRLLHDLKRIGQAIQIICDEEDKGRRKVVADLLRAELDRLIEDVNDVRERNKDIIQKRKKQ